MYLNRDYCLIDRQWDPNIGLSEKVIGSTLQNMTRSGEISRDVSSHRVGHLSTFPVLITLTGHHNSIQGRISS